MGGLRSNDSVPVLVTGDKVGLTLAQGDARYLKLINVVDSYSKTESDNRFFPFIGGTVNGNISVQGNVQIASTKELRFGDTPLVKERWDTAETTPMFKSCAPRWVFGPTNILNANFFGASPPDAGSLCVLATAGADPLKRVSIRHDGTNGAVKCMSGYLMLGTALNPSGIQIGDSGTIFRQDINLGSYENLAIVCGSASGLKILRDPGHKLGFYNATPVSRQVAGSVLGLPDTSGGDTVSRANLDSWISSARTEINRLRTHFVNLGLTA